MEQALYDRLRDHLGTIIAEQIGRIIADELIKKYDVKPKPYQVPKMPQKYRNISNAPIVLRREIHGVEVDRIEPGGYIEATFAQEAREDGTIVLGARRIWPRDDYRRDSERTADGYYARGTSGYMVTQLAHWEAIPDRTPPSASIAPGLR